MPAALKGKITVYSCLCICSHVRKLGAVILLVFFVLSRLFRVHICDTSGGLHTAMGKAVDSGKNTNLQ